MTELRPHPRGLMFKLALFYALLALPTLVVVESVLLAYEFREFSGGVSGGSVERAAEQGATELAGLWPHLSGVAGPDDIALQLWLDAWVLRLQQPRGGLTPDESYVLMELSDMPLAAAIVAADARLLASSHGDGHWNAQWPSAAEAERALASGASAIALEGFDGEHLIRRSLVPLGHSTGTPAALLFVELRVMPPWRRLWLDSSFESATVLAFLIVFGLASSIFLAAWVTRRLNRIAGAASAWSRGDFSSLIDDRSNDELGHVSALLDRMARDLQGLLRSRAQLATLAERQRLARDLHDTVKQKAFALNLQLATARRLLGDTPGAERLQPAQRLTQQIQQELGLILDEMRASDADLPLAERVRSRANEWAHSSSVTPTLQLDDVPPLAAPIEDSLLRIVDEALSNVLRHSGADRVEVSLRREAERVRLSIADNGRGTAAASTSGMGLRNMRERAQALPHGRFDIDAADGQGTRVTVSFLAAENATR